MEMQRYPWVPATAEEAPKAPARPSEDLTREMQRAAEKIWNALSKLMTVDSEGIFKDPDWPHLWEHKR